MLEGNLKVIQHSTYAGKVYKEKPSSVIKAMIDPEEIEKFSGEWVLIFEDKIINHSCNLEEMLKLAEDYPRGEVTIAKLPSKPSTPHLLD
ncbi:MAG TPA: hypothetical protein ENI42_00605 [Thermoplasmatales archaeon]|nr:hypothetical protein [Thermoplasmatales archaeon]